MQPYVISIQSFLFRRYHNYLRITRMLKSLGEFGFEHYKAPFVEKMLRLALTGEQLLLHSAKSCVEYWIHTLRDDEARQRLQNEAEQLIRDELARIPGHGNLPEEQWYVV